MFITWQTALVHAEKEKKGATFAHAHEGGVTDRRPGHLGYAGPLTREQRMINLTCSSHTLPVHFAYGGQHCDRQ